jgi:hypothetical protein
MRPFSDADSKHIERLVRQSAVFAGLLAFGLAWVDKGDLSVAYRFVVFAGLSPPIGCLIFVLIHRMTGGQWASGLRPYLLAGVSILPWIWLFALPIPLLPLVLGHQSPPRNPAAHGYESWPMVIIRSCIYAAVFFALSRAVASDAGRGSLPARNQRPWVGPVGLIVLVFTLTLLADDWIACLDPGWHSTGFALVWITGQAVAGLSLALLGSLASGTRPVSEGTSGRALGIDWGNLLLASLLAWCYVGFAQFLIIWAGNLPAETTWFTHRMEGPWFLTLPLLALFGFLLPFLMLLSRRLKASAGGLALVAVMLLLSQGLYTAWLILPSAGHLSPVGWLLVLALLAAGMGSLADRYLAIARGSARSRP